MQSNEHYLNNFLTYYRLETGVLRATQLVDTFVEHRLNCAPIRVHSSDFSE